MCSRKRNREIQNENFLERTIKSGGIRPHSKRFAMIQPREAYGVRCIPALFVLNASDHKPETADRPLGGVLTAMIPSGF